MCRPLAVRARERNRKPAPNLGDQGDGADAGDDPGALLVAAMVRTQIGAVLPEGVHRHLARPRRGRFGRCGFGGDGLQHGHQLLLYNI
jgi:hypothetical protein